MKAGIWLAGMLALAPLCAGAQSGFEGSVSMTVHAKGQDIPIDYAIKGHKARVEMHAMGRTNVILLDMDTNTQTILIPELKSYAVHAGDSHNALSSAAPPKIASMGTTETIAGHTCDDYRLESAKYSGTACMTREFGDAPLAQAMDGPLGQALGGEDLLLKSGMPLKVTIVFKEGAKAGDTTVVEVTKVAPGPLDDAQFSVPDGWHKLSGLSGLQ